VMAHIFTKHLNVVAHIFTLAYSQGTFDVAAFASMAFFHSSPAGSAHFISSNRGPRKKKSLREAYLVREAL